jgi:hypothetical protein
MHPQTLQLPSYAVSLPNWFSGVKYGIIKWTSDLIKLEALGPFNLAKEKKQSVVRALVGLSALSIIPCHLTSSFAYRGGPQGPLHHPNNAKYSHLLLPSPTLSPGLWHQGADCFVGRPGVGGHCCLLVSWRLTQPLHAAVTSCDAMQVHLPWWCIFLALTGHTVTV